MRGACTLILALTCLSQSQAQPTRYLLAWESAQPVQLQSVTVRGGALVSVFGSELAGVIEARADRACLTISADGRTTAGAGVRFARSWDAECVRVFAPFVVMP